MTLLNCFSFLFIFLIPIGMILYHTHKKKTDLYKGASLVCAFSLIFLVVINHDQFEILKIAGFEAQLKKTQEVVNQANASAQQLRAIAVAVASPIYSQMAFQGLFDFSPSFQSKYQIVRDLNNTLKEIGIPQSKIDDISDVWTMRVGFGLANLIIRDKDNEPILKPEELAEWDNMIFSYFCPRDTERVLRPSPEKIREFLTDKKIFERVKDRFDDYEHFFKTGEVIHPENWQTGYSGLPQKECAPKSSK